ncbi:SusC/RagA family TonB-linked outer membrane protein [Flavobacterium qiangtangense]|uniref:SusC/RagA family TonB-linked outer membrane protein n=1 Tax=Flavobacterium qiangtangense TaxID=1442595 RepID=A0ABW1PIU0_9FLAO
MKNFIFGVFVFLFYQGQMMAQDIKGKVLDETGLPLPGVTITNANSTSSAATDFDGNFSINAQAGELLTFTFLGFTTQTVPASQSMSVSMSSSATNIEEVVVVGYGTQKRSDLTSAISTIKSDQISKQPAYNALQSIQGKAAGVNIIANDAPGSTPTIIIRGLGTAEGGRSPMFVVDGIITGSIANLNPNDIESFDVMKDAASSAIYGSNAANGVVFITTKKGKQGKTQIKVNSFYGAKSILNPIEMANSSQFVTYYNESQTAIGSTNRLSANQPYDTDWYDALVGTSFSQSNDVSFSGGNENATYFFSFNNYSEDGLLAGHDVDRNTLRSSNTLKAFEGKLKITQNFSASFNKSTPKPYGSFTEAYKQAPVVPVYYPDGRYGTPFWNTTTGLPDYIIGPGQQGGKLNAIGNPVANVNFTNEKNKMMELQGLIQADYTITDWLTATSRFGATKSYAKNRIYTDIRGRYLAADPTLTSQDFDNSQAGAPGSTQFANNSLSYEDVESFRYNWDTYLTFDKLVGKHRIGATAGVTQERRNDVYHSLIRGYNVSTEEQYWNINMAAANPTRVAEQYFETPTNILSYFGRLQYNFDEKYYISGTVRRDGNSNFKKNADYWGTFPSVSAGWVVSNESFLKDVKNLDFLKIRAGYGEVGNANVPFNATSIKINAGSANTNYVFGPNQDLIFGGAVGSPAKDLTWEVTKELNIGADFELLNRRLSGTFDYYNRLNTNAILLIKPVPNSPATDDFYDHGGEIRNKGYEASLNWRDNITDDFSYSIGVNYAHNTNTLENVKPEYEGRTGGSLGDGQITKRLTNGQPVYSWWMYEAVGVWQTQDEIDANTHIGGAAPGHLRYKDQNGDGVIDDRDKKNFGSYIPKFSYGVNISLAYKNFDFSADGFGVGGNKVYNGLKGTRVDAGENIALDTYNNRWHGAGTSTTNPGASRDALSSSYFLEDGDYFRINNITLGYTFKDMFSLSKLRIYGTAQNPFMFTKYSGLTPELNNSGIPSETAGIELAAYPQIKTFIFGVNIEF